MKKYKYYATWGRGRKPKLQSGAEEILRDLPTYTGGTTGLNKMWRVLSKYKASEARILITRESPKAELIFDKKKPNIAKQKIGMNMDEISDKYTPMYYFVRIFDSYKQYSYDKYTGKIRLRTGPALYSIKEYSISSLKNPIVRVYTRGKVSGKNNIVQLGKLVYEQKLL